MKDENLIVKNIDEIKKSSNNIILFGSVGSGKTTLINKLCKCNFKTKNDSFICTKDVEYSKTHDGSLIIDFPGLNSSDDRVMILRKQISNLSLIPAKMICLVIKLTTRYDDMIKSALQMIKIFNNNINNIAIIISFCENISIKTEEDIKFILEKKYNIKKENIILTSNNMSSEELLTKLNKIKSNMSNIEKIKFKERDLLSSFEYDFDIDFIEEREKFLKEFKIKLEMFKKDLNTINDNLLKFILCFTLFDFKEDLIERFFNTIKKTEPNIHNIDIIIVEVITLNNELFYDFNDFVNRVQSDLDSRMQNIDSKYKNTINKKLTEIKSDIYDKKVKEIIDSFY